MITLRGEPGYYSSEVEINGSIFQIRELDDAELKAHLQAVQNVQKVAGLEVSSDDLLDDTAMGRIVARMDPEKQVAVVAAMREALDIVAVAGTVKWPLAQDCTPENIRRLPPPVRLKLARAIMRDTTLTEGEQAF